MSGFTKLFSSIVHSTVWREDMHVKVVWVTMLALADRNGHVLVSLPGLADAARVSLKQCQNAIEKLSGPDKWSRTKDHDGKRIEATEGGWKLLNYLKYREMRDADERRIYNREAVRRHRLKPLVIKKRNVSRGKPRKAQAEAEAEADLKKDQDQSATPTKRSIADVRKHLTAAAWLLLASTEKQPNISELTNALKDIAAKDLGATWSTNEVAAIADEVLAQWDKRRA